MATDITNRISVRLRRGVPAYAAAFCCAVCTALLYMGCAAHAVQYTYDKRLLADAESSFENKNYADALKIYQELASSPTYSRSEAAKTALFRIGYINIFYDNPKADPKAALDALNSFRARFPGDKREGEVNTLTKLLVVLKGFEDQYDETTSRMRKLQSKTGTAVGDLDSLLETMQRCSAERDTLGMEKTALLKKIGELEQTIVKMEKSK